MGHRGQEAAVLPFQEDGSCVLMMSPSVFCSVLQEADMSVLYPSLEDLKVGQVIQVRNQAPFA